MALRLRLRVPGDRPSWWCLLPTVNTGAFALALATFARDEGIDADHRAVLVVDQAGWHVAHDLVLPEGIDWCCCPPYSPELQPAERLWPLVDEPIANRALATSMRSRRCWSAAAAPSRPIVTPPSAHPLPLVAQRPSPGNSLVITRNPYYGTLLTVS